MKHSEHYKQLILIAYFISSAGNWLFKFATPLYIFQYTQSASLMSAAYIAQFLPMVLISPFVGYIADKFEHKKLLLSLDFLGTVGCFLISWLFVVDSPALFFIGFSFLLSCITTSYHALFQGFIPFIFTSNEQANVGGNIAFIDSFFPVTGPVIGALVATVLPYDDALLVVGGGFLLSLCLTTVVPFKPRNELPSFTLLESIKKGFRAVWDSYFMRFAVMRFFLVGLSLNCFVSLFVFYLKSVQSLSDFMVGMVYALSFTGLLLGKSLAHLIYRRELNKSVVLSFTGYGSSLSIIGMAFSPNLPVVVALWSLITAMSTINVTILYKERQLQIAPNLLPHGVAISNLLIFLSFPLGGLFASIFVTQLPLATLFLLCGCYIALLSTVFLFKK